MSHLASAEPSLGSAALCGHSSALLLIFTNTWGTPAPAVVEALREELRALDTALLVVGEDSLFYFNARPHAAAGSLSNALDGASLAALRRKYPSARRSTDGLTLSLVEPNGRERFGFSRKLRGAPHPAVLEALQIARQSVHLPTRLRSFTEHELLFYSLVGALNLVLSDAPIADSSAPHAQA